MARSGTTRLARTSRRRWQSCLVVVWWQQFDWHRLQIQHQVAGLSHGLSNASDARISWHVAYRSSQRWQLRTSWTWRPQLAENPFDALSQSLTDGIGTGQQSYDIAFDYLDLFGDLRWRTGIHWRHVDRGHHQQGLNDWQYRGEIAAETTTGLFRGGDMWRYWLQYADDATSALAWSYRLPDVGDDYVTVQYTYRRPWFSAGEWMSQLEWQSDQSPSSGWYWSIGINILY